MDLHITLNKTAHKGQAAMSFNRLFEKSPTKSSFKWSVLIVDKGECMNSKAINFGT